MRGNNYIASFKIESEGYLIPCEYLSVNDHCTTVHGIPLTGIVGYTVILASIPKDVFVQLIELKEKKE